MADTARVSQKAFWEAVESRLQACSAEDLRAILRGMAQQTRPPERRAFLEALGQSGDVGRAKLPAGQETLLDDIDDLAQELAAAMEEAEPWEEEYEYGWGGYEDYYDEQGEEAYEQFFELLAELFDRAEAAFDFGQLALAREAYEKLWEILEAEDDYGGGVSASSLTGVDMGEARARYLRAVYETEPPTTRVRTMFGRMRQARSWLAAEPTLDDLVQISPRPLPDGEQFLEEWIAFLREQSGRDADAWLREAVRTAHGTQGLAALARAEGTARPHAYLDWFETLEREGHYREVLVEAAEALKVLPARLHIRAEVADHLYTAATRMGEPEVQRAARWEAFLAVPSLSRLLDLWDLRATDEARIALMKQAAEQIRSMLSHQSGGHTAPRSPGYNVEGRGPVDQDLLAHALLLAGELEETRQLVAKQQVLGWTSTSSAQGLVVAFLLALLSGQPAEALSPGIETVWQWGLGHTTGYKEDSAHLRKRLEKAYAGRLSTAQVPHGKQNALLAWCLKVAEERVDAIVGNQHRKSYHKAAALTAACAEALRSRGADKAADAFVSQIRNRYPRHRAFQSDLQGALK